MKKTILISLVLLVVAGAVFAQEPTLDKLRLQSMGSTSSVQAANKQISGEVVIPATHRANSRDQPVVVISADGFRDCTGITSVVLPASINQMNPNAFAGCTNLTSVTFLGPHPAGTGTIANRFPGDLADKWRAGGPGTYTRTAGSNTWTKQSDVVDGIVCPHCGQLIPGAVWR